eukprot:CAMPEP_0116827342 /NCGR_PEP_ID=MMETSP0418-20121206/3046_1 /TAXON_ID=1158023 /ORGANISM="Astrosyne radiata, Strain 13vi08-1A" /LENGTH=176 /DNA_ID=CAMNT_0004456107 /DNA_START=370 /DNA_END=897 /DNA_ORIENTATION=+
MTKPNLDDIEKQAGGKSNHDERKPQPSWHAMTIYDSVAELNLPETLIMNGLSSAEATKRLQQYGLNKLTEARKKTLLERIWDQVANVLVLILVVVAVVSAVRAATATISDDVVTNTIQVGLIVGVITLNTYIGIVQEGSAEKAAEALKSMLSSDARVIRDGSEQMIPSTEVVPGDV